MVATNIKCIHGEVKVYNSLFQYLDQASLKCRTVRARLCFNSDVIVLQTTRHRRLWIAFATAIAYGQNPTRQNYKQEEMRPHLVNCFNKNSMSVFPCK